MADTRFRTWMDQLQSDKGARPEWPLLLSWMLDAEFLRERQVDRRYTGACMLVDRTKHEIAAQVAEKRATYGLCRRCWKESSGCLQIGETPIWLLSYEVPNQLNERRRCADLVGLTADGALVVFEAKLGRNSSHPPLSAVLEGLDYLSCLTEAGAFESLVSQFRSLKPRLPVPPGFEDTEPRPNVTPLLVILADAKYYTFHDDSGRSPGWRDFLQHCHRTTSVRIRFAQSEPDSEGVYTQPMTWLA